MADADLLDADPYGEQLLDLSHQVQEDLFDDDEYRMMGTAFVDAEPLPPGLDWDYFGPRPGLDDAGELGDTENPAVDAVFDWGQPLIGCDCDGVPVVSGGERFRKLVRQLHARGVRNPQALAAWIGRRKYGSRRFAQMAAAGRR